VLDSFVISLRALGFICALQAAGVALFLGLFDADMAGSANKVRSFGKRIAITGILATAAYQLAQPVRMVGAFGGVLDGSLQTMILQSDLGTTHAVRVMGLIMIVFAVARTTRFAQAVAVIGVTLVAVSFAFMGHTVTQDQRWLLAALLTLHILVVAFWFGALIPMYIASRYEKMPDAGRLFERFSAIATWLVPVIFVAGLAMTLSLVPDLASLRTNYGYSILAKVVGFSVLMLLAAANKWNLGPRIAAGDPVALPLFRRSVLIEVTLITIVLVVTAVMTSLFSIGH
jgi:putative copper resistance protein D